MPVNVFVGQTCWGRCADWQVMTPTETWNSLWTKLSAYLPASQPAHLPVSHPLGQEVEPQPPHHLCFYHNNHRLLIILVIVRSSLCHRHHTPTVFQPSRCLPLSQSVSLLLIATVLPKVFPLSPPLPITFLLFFNFFQSVTILLNPFPSPTPVIVTLSDKLSFIFAYKDWKIENEGLAFISSPPPPIPFILFGMAYYFDFNSPCGTKTEKVVVVV